MSWPSPTAGELPKPEIEPRSLSSLALAANSLPLHHVGLFFRSVLDIICVIGIQYGDSQFLKVILYSYTIEYTLYFYSYYKKSLAFALNETQSQHRGLL